MKLKITGMLLKQLYQHVTMYNATFFLKPCYLLILKGNHDLVGGSESVKKRAYRWQNHPELDVHDVILVELQQGLVEVGFEHRGVGDEARGYSKQVLKLAPDGILGRVGCLWVLCEEGEVSD